MINEASLERVYLACGCTDLRKAIDGLAVLVKEGFQLDPFSPCLFVFCNRKRDKLKMHIPAHPDGESGGIRTANRKYPDTLSVDLICY